jgi:hypothetical protein
MNFLPIWVADRSISTPHTESCSPELRVIIDSGLTGCSRGDEYRLEIGFDGEAAGRQIDFQPALPLTLSG